MLRGSGGPRDGSCIEMTEIMLIMLYAPPRGKVCMKMIEIMLIMLYAPSRGKVCIKMIETSKFEELWSPARQQIWPWSRSKVKVTTWYQKKGLVTRIMHAKYQCSIINTSEDMSQVKVFVTEGLTDRRTDRRTDEWVLMSPAFAKGGGQLC